MMTESKIAIEPSLLLPDAEAWYLETDAVEANPTTLLLEIISWTLLLEVTSWTLLPEDSTSAVVEIVTAVVSGVGELATPEVISGEAEVCVGDATGQNVV